MNLDKLKRSAETTKDELERAAKAHAELARNQYEEITERHGDPVKRIEDAVRGPIELTKLQVEELSKDVNERTENLALELTERTDQVGKVVNAEAERLTREFDQRTREVRRLVNERFGFEPTVRTEPVSQTVDEQPDGTTPEEDAEADAASDDAADEKAEASEADTEASDEASEAEDAEDEA